MRRRVLPRSLVLIAAVATAVLAGSAGAASAVEFRTDVNDFEFSSWDATYEVGIDEEGRATLHVEETRVAEFPTFDQNRGIVAGYPTRYQGADIDTTILSVRDENGDDVPYETEDDDDMVFVLTGDDDYVHGSTTYVIEYEMRDVVLAATKTKVDEFNWNLLPLDSTQGIDSFHAEITFVDGLASHLTGDSACYQGLVGSRERCELRTQGDNTFTVDERDIAAEWGITVAIGLEAGTITQPAARLPNAATDVWPYWLGGGTIALSIAGWLAARALVRSRRRGTGIVVAQYDVPDSMPPLLASALIPNAKTALAAQIVHLAVRGMLRLEDLPEDDGKKKRRPRLRRLDAPAPDPLDEKALDALFQGAGTDTVVKIPKNSSSFAARMQKLLESGPKEAERRGFTTKERSTGARIVQAFALVVFAAMVVLFLWALLTGRESAGPVAFVTLVSAAVTLVATFAAFHRYTVLTREGAMQLEYLEGVREFIRVAEADRLRMLQSYTGAERRSDGSVDVIHIYEKLLPFAILFGQEKEWGEVLESAYSQAHHDPAWVNGTYLGLTYRMSSFSSATQSSSTYVSPSSSAGGSTGGGFSGGGGGGGFSGGR